jgi:hypothetical protein
MFSQPDQHLSQLRADRLVAYCLVRRKMLICRPIAILIYDYFVLLPDEVRYFWATPFKLSVTPVLFFLNRYLWLAVAPFALFTKFLPLSDSVCFNVQRNYHDKHNLCRSRMQR